MKILIIEDNDADIFLLKEFIAEYENAPEFCFVTDGEQALDYIFQRKQYSDAERPDIILLDLNLPRIDGFEVLKQLKTNPASAAVPVIVLTTSRNPADHTSCSRLGADIFLSKPFTHQEFSQLMQQLLSWAFLRKGDVRPGQAGNSSA